MVRSTALILVSLLLVAAAPHRAQIAKAAPLDPLHRALAAAHFDQNKHVVDKFAGETVDVSDAGKPFRLELSFGDSAGNAVTPVGKDLYFSYEKGRLELIVARNEGMISIGTRYRWERPFVGQNGYGARTAVHVRNGSEDAIKVVSAPEGEVFPDVEPSMYSDRDTYWVGVPLAGPQAKALAIDARAIIEGHIARLDAGKITGCDTNYQAADVQNPTEIYGDRCWVGVKIDRISIIRKSTGETLKQWASPAE